MRLRRREIDWGKGILIAAMVLCHVLQFFGRVGEDSVQYWITFAVNATAFSAFTFAYGRSIQIAYLEKTFKAVGFKMLRSALRAYAAFVISGVGYRVLVEGKDFSFPVIRQVAVLKAFPGWSEFLISFALYGAAAIVLFPVWKKLLSCKIAFWIVWTLSFAAVLVPYDRIANIRIAMLIGGRQASFFPILQYLPYFLMGMYISKYGMRKPGFWILGAALLTGAGLARTLIAGEPSRFPPSIWWILLAWLPIAVAHVSLKALADRIGDKAAIALKPLGNMGANSLYFLLASNLTIFAVSRTGVMPLYRKSAPFPFYLKQGTTGWAIAWTAIMLIVIGFTARLAGKRAK